MTPGHDEPGAFRSSSHLVESGILRVLEVISGGKAMPNMTKAAFFLTTLTLAVGLAAAPGFTGEKTQTFIGEVSDAVCLAEHMMPGSAAQCTHKCVGNGSKFALVVGDKVYTLEVPDKINLAALDKLAGEQAKVTGSAEGLIITVKAVAVAPAK